MKPLPLVAARDEVCEIKDTNEPRPKEAVEACLFHTGPSGGSFIGQAACGRARACRVILRTRLNRQYRIERGACDFAGDFAESGLMQQSRVFRKRPLAAFGAYQHV